MLLFSVFDIDQVIERFQVSACTDIVNVYSAEIMNFSMFGELFKDI